MVFCLYEKVLTTMDAQRLLGVLKDVEESEENS